jgi:sulfotransferase family protein
MALPTFIVIGAQKAATTSLYAYLRHHPDIYLPALKETNFFVADGGWPRGIGWYESLFAAGARRAHRGEVSPSYSFFPLVGGVPERMATVVPDVKLVYLVRHPIERMRSSYVQALTDGIETRTIDAALRVNTRYITGSSYALQLEQYLRCFSRDRVLVLKTEDLEREPQAAIDELLCFLELAPGWAPPNLGELHNAGAAKRAPTAIGRRVDRQLRRRQLRRRPWAERAFARSPMSRPLRDGETTIDVELRGQLERWVRPDLARFVELVDIDPWGLLEEEH